MQRAFAVVATCGAVALLTNASLPACVVLAVAGYLSYACLCFFGSSIKEEY